jgi:uncharacterized repeat protein (TIGR03803 family)
MGKQNWVATVSVALSIAAATVPSAGAEAASESVIWTFQGSDGAVPVSNPLIDSKGNLYLSLVYGGYYGEGSIVELSPPVKGSTAWTEQVLYNFTGGSDGCNPLTDITADSTGNLYGTTRFCGAGYGVVFELLKPASGSTTWKENVLYGFEGTGGVGSKDGAYPTGGVVFNSKKELFGTTYAGGSEGLGIVFELTPPASGKTVWTEHVLHSFKGGTDAAVAYGGLLVDSSGNLFGMTSGGGQGYGTVYELAAPASGSSSYTESVLFKFDGATGAYPQNKLVMDSAGALYGTADNGGLGCSPFNCGDVFKLSPPAAGHTVWTQTVLHNFLGGTKDGGDPSGAVLLGSGGVVYGTTQSFGTGSQGILFRLTPPAAGSTVWTEAVLHDFTGSPDGAYPAAGLVADKAGTLYGTAQNGGNANNDGIVFKITP